MSGVMPVKVIWRSYAIACSLPHFCRAFLGEAALLIVRKGLRLRALLPAAIATVFIAASAAQPKATDAPHIAPLKMTEVAPGVFVHQGAYALAAPSNGGAIANAGFIIGRDAVAVIDSGGSLQEGRQLKAAIRQRTNKPIRYVINTHMHPDHVLGNAAFTDEAQVAGHHKLKRALATRGDYYLERARESVGAEAMKGTKIAGPAIEVEDTLTLDLGQRRLTLRAHPTAHTDNDLTVLDEETGTLFLGDLLFVRHLPTLDGSLKGWLAVMKDLERLNVQRAVPGHGPPSVNWPQALEPQRRYLMRLLDGVRQKIASGVRIAEAARSVGLEERDAWALFDEFNARNVSAAYAELEWE